MNDIFMLILSFAGGMALGAFYFMNLWKTVKKMTDGNDHNSRFVFGFFIRTGVVLAGFYIIMSGRWERICLAMFGFIVMREIIKWVVGRYREPA